MKFKKFQRGQYDLIVILVILNKQIGGESAEIMNIKYLNILSGSGL